MFCLTDPTLYMQQSNGRHGIYLSFFTTLHLKISFPNNVPCDSADDIATEQTFQNVSVSLCPMAINESSLFSEILFSELSF